jgi:dephospho-CoA kinase
MLTAMLVVGLTGGIGSGKTTVSELFHSLGVPVIDADQISHQIVKPGAPALEAIVDAFGAELLNPDGSLNRAALRAQVFSDARQRALLESILHPRIKTVILDRIAQLDSEYCLVVVPLLIEKNWTDIVDRILVVDTPVTLQRERIKARDRQSIEQVDAILKTQLSREARLAAADDVITNDSDMRQLRSQVDQLHQKYRKIAQAHRKC